MRDVLPDNRGRNMVLSDHAKFQAGAPLG